MGDKYDDLADAIGIPLPLRTAWRQRAGAPAAAPAAAPTPQLRPGDPGWSITGSTPPQGGTVGLPSPPGPRPGDPGFDVTKMPNQPAPMPPPPPRPMPPPAKPARPPTLGEQAAASNASIDNVTAERRKDVADLTKLSPKTASKLAADQRATEENVKKATAEQGDRERLASATFADGSGADVAGGPPGAGAPVMTSPGGRTPASWATQTQEGTKLAPETKEAAEAAEQAGYTAAGAHLGAEEREAGRELDVLHAHELAQQARATEVRERAERQNAQLEDSRAKLKELTDKAAKGELDGTDAYWTKKGAAGVVMAGLGILIGGVGQGIMAGAAHISGPNYGLQMVQEGIASEIQHQKDQAAHNRMKLEDQRGLLGQMAKTFGDENAAEGAAWLVYLEKVKTQLAASAAEAKGDFAKARYADAIKSIDGEIAARREKWDQLEQDRVTRVQHDVNAPPTYAGAAGGPLDKRDREERGHLSDELEKAGIPRDVATLNNIDRSIDTFGKGDIPGTGPIASHIPSVVYGVFGGDRAVAARQAFQDAKLQTQHAIAGASLTSGEKAELDVMLKGAYDASSLRRVVQNFREKLSLRARNIAAGAGDRARADYNRNYESVGREHAPYNVPRNAPSAPFAKPPE